MTAELDLRSRLQAKAHELGFHKVGIAAVEAADNSPDNSPDNDTAHRLQEWLAQGYQADMHWMSNPKRQDIYQVMPDVKSVIAVALNYYVPQDRPEGNEYAKISRYGWGRDYHKVLHKKLKALAQWLEAQGDGIQARYYADTGPVQDKVWAQRSGLGWIAKNGNLITRDYGSWVFLGEVLVNVEFVPDRPHTAHCGTCTRCLEACPTGAIVRPTVVDANRCIAYHTIENRAETLPPEITTQMQGWVAGCDICQDVCPWNQRFAQATDVPDFQPRPWNVAPTLNELAELTEAEYERRFTGSALRRIKAWMWHRNARANLPAETSVHNSHGKS